MPRQASLTLDLLRTFLLLVRNQGDAATTAAELNINQPSMSKRLRNFQHAGPLLERPWLDRQGKTWKLTQEGQRVLPAVEEIVARHEQLARFIHEPIDPGVHFACGQQAIQGFVRRAARTFCKQNPETRLRMATLRGDARIEGVANGSLDLATVTHAVSDIHQVARRELHTETICEDHLVLACTKKSAFADAVTRLPKTKVPTVALGELPLILPHRDAGLRRWFDVVVGQEGVLGDLDIVLETGGWPTILAYIHDGFGVGIVPDSIVQGDKRLVIRRLNPQVFPPRQTRLICRWLDMSQQQLDLSEAAQAFRQALMTSVD